MKTNFERSERLEQIKQEKKLQHLTQRRAELMKEMGKKNGKQ